VPIKDLSRCIAAHGGLSSAEADELSRVLAEADSDGELVSYSAFLAACLAAHVVLDDHHLRRLFDRLDTNGSGRVDVDKVCSALGDVLDLETVRAEFASGELIYSDFRWLMLAPGGGPSILGLQQLLRESSTVEGSWRLSTRRAKVNQSSATGTVEAARRENMAWRVMNKRMQLGDIVSDEPLHTPPKSPQVALSVESMILGRGWRTQCQLEGMTDAEKRAVMIDWLVSTGVGTVEELQYRGDEDLADLCRPRSNASSATSEASEDEEEELGPAMLRTPTRLLIESKEDPREGWLRAKALAREGDLDAARRENVSWRKMQLRASKATGLATSAPLSA